MAYGYTYQGYNKEKMARAVGVSLPISHKQAVEICNHLKHRSVDSAKNIISRVMKKKEAIPFKRFNMDVGHKPGIAAGRYPQNASREILKIIESAVANASNKGISTDLYITHMNAHKAPPSPRTGRIPGEAKRAHVEVIVEEKKVEKKTKRPESKAAKEIKEEAKKSEKVEKNVEEKKEISAEVKVEKQDKKLQSKKKEVKPEETQSKTLLDPADRRSDSE